MKYLQRLKNKITYILNYSKKMENLECDNLILHSKVNQLILNSITLENIQIDDTNLLNTLNTILTSHQDILELFRHKDTNIYCIISKHFTDETLYILIYKITPSMISHGGIFSRLRDKTIYINDIQCTGQLGYGSFLMKSLINYANNHKFHSICGRLETTDLKSHKERLYHFYQKHGFTISDTKDEYSKFIELIISSNSSNSRTF